MLSQRPAVQEIPVGLLGALPSLCIFALLLAEHANVEPEALTMMIHVPERRISQALKAASEKTVGVFEPTGERVVSQLCRLTFKHGFQPNIAMPPPEPQAAGKSSSSVAGMEASRPAPTGVIQKRE